MQGISAFIKHFCILEQKYKRGVITYIFSGKCNKFAAEATWTEKTLADLCCEFRSGRNISASLITETGEYAVYGGNGIRGYCDHYSHEGEYVVVGRQGALCGNVRLIQGKNYLSEHAIARGRSRHAGVPPRCPGPPARIIAGKNGADKSDKIEHLVNFIRTNCNIL